ncbi:MAG: DUF190 domain-containing protein [Bryobacteraceae bacterium]|nr:DUF190 domain-containing protein [Bryobacteraceae bacterium]
MKHLQLTIYLAEADRSQVDAVGESVPLHEAIVRRLLHDGIAGATVLRGVMGYGKHHRVHRSGLFGVSDDRPVVIVAVDEEARIRAVLPEIRTLLSEELITVHSVEVI